MSCSFTYQTEDNNTALEAFEWDNTWIHKTFDKENKRVLYIGDSISAGIKTYYWKNQSSDINIDNFATSKALDNRFFKECLSLFAKQEGERNAIIFNNGLHGWHLSEDEYGMHFEKMINFLRESFVGTPIALVLTTGLIAPVPEERAARALKRNEIVIKLADKYNLPIIDLYSASVKIANLHTGDGVHFTDEGNKFLTETLLTQINNLL